MKFNVKVKIEWNMGNIEAIKEAGKPALANLLEALDTEIKTAQVVPKDKGVLEESAATFQEEKVGGISWNTPYARKLFFNPQFNFSKLVNINAQGRWTDYWQYGEGSKWIKNACAEFLKVHSKGVIK